MPYISYDSTFFNVNLWYSNYPVPPTVYVDQDDVIVKEGDSITLECRANAQPTPTIQWYKGRLAVVPSRRIATSSRGHLVINAAQRSDSGFYTCVALNIAGSDSVRVSFSVQGKYPHNISNYEPGILISIKRMICTIDPQKIENETKMYYLNLCIFRRTSITSFSILCACEHSTLFWNSIRCVELA